MESFCGLPQHLQPSNLPHQRDDLAFGRAKRSLDKDITDATAARATIREDASTVAAYDMIILSLQRARAALEAVAPVDAPMQPQRE